MNELNRSLIIGIFLSLFLLSVGKNETDGQQKDLLVFKKVLLQKEGRLDLHVHERVIREDLDFLREKFKTSLSLIDQFKLYAATLSRIQCGHTQIHPNRDVLKEWLSHRKSLPFDYYLVGKRLVVNHTLPIDLPLIHENKSEREKKKSIPAGAEIISIDGKTVSEMMEGMSRFISSDENSMAFKYYQASQLFEFYRHLNHPFSADSLLVVYVNAGDTVDTYFQLGAAPVHTMNQRLHRFSKEIDQNGLNIGAFNIIDNRGYFRFKSFKASFGPKYEVFLRNSFGKLKKRGITELVIDLRGNTGGAMQYQLMRYFVGEGVDLGRYVVEKPKNGFENSHLKKLNSDYFKHRRMSRIQKRLVRRGEFNRGSVVSEEVDESLIFKGKVVIITDEGTFSSAAVLAGQLKSLVNAKIAGSEAGGSFYSGNAGTLILELPKSKFTLFINPNTYYSHLTPVADPLLIKQPDKWIETLEQNERKRDRYFFQQAIQLLE